MTDAGKRATDKLSIIKNIAESHEVKEMAKILIEYIGEVEKGVAGFSAEGKK